ncbi:hypothetical protein K1T71_007168 [Dendrolimus kikuchii]|uniref:Uncharacterized protein n=1 Tax=Dendrolimus kikuchii TaxID=765133 RepID=A0ACC1D0B7_9NEOP|nr:hypothetical protein K1T71_007168 [Dendrolimus kikuchii]
MFSGMTPRKSVDGLDSSIIRGARSHSAQGLTNTVSSPAIKIPLPPRLWITDIEDESSDEIDNSLREDGTMHVERPRVRSRYRHHKQKSVNIPIGIFWDIENCQIPRGCSAIDVVAAIRAKFLTGRREADFVVVCDVRKESAYRLQELNDAQVNLIHVCGTQKNAADEKLRQCMRRFGELHSAPAALLLISGDINFAADLSDFRHRKNMEVILVHQQNTSSALIKCASSHYCYSKLTASLPRNPKWLSLSCDDGEPTNEIMVVNLPMDQPPERVSRRLRRLADNCGGKVLRVTATTAHLRFPSVDHATRALKRMDGEDVFGRKISTRYARGFMQPTYSSDEGYSTAPTKHSPNRGSLVLPPHQIANPSQEAGVALGVSSSPGPSQWALALSQLPAPTPPPLGHCPPPAPKLRKIRGTHGSVNLDRSGCSSSNSGEERGPRGAGHSRATSPWNSSSVSEQSEGEPESTVELTVSNLPFFEPTVLQEMLTKLVSAYAPVVRVSVWNAGDGPLATVVLSSEWDARLVISRLHKKRLDLQWTGRRLELSLGRPSPAPNVDVLRARLRAILLDQPNHSLPLLRLRDAYASRHCCALTTSDIAKVKDTVIMHESFGRIVQLIDTTPVSNTEVEEAPWKCHVHMSMNGHQEDGTRILQPVFIELSVLAANVQLLLESHNGVLPLLSFVDCYEATFRPLIVDAEHGVVLELLLRSIPGLEVKETPSRHLAWRVNDLDSSPTSNQSVVSGESSRSSNERERPRTAPTLEPMLALFERELTDLLRTTPRCSIPFSKLIPKFHHHFGRQCRVADYGFTKLPDLLAALSDTIVVLGSGSNRVITISCAAQARRWTCDLVKVLKAHPGRSLLPPDLPKAYQDIFGRAFTPVNYGVCTFAELMQRITPNTVIVASDGMLSLPRRAFTQEERTRTMQFARETVELLCHTPNLRMEFSQFVPAFHAHFRRQLRVANYGCVKLVEVLELIPETVAVCAGVGGERVVRLARRVTRPVLARRLRAITPVPATLLAAHYAKQYGAPPTPEMLEVSSLEELIYAAGGCIEDGIVYGAGGAPKWTSTLLAACAALCSDRSVARGSTMEYLRAATIRMCGEEPAVGALLAAGVVWLVDRWVLLKPEWRAVWRLARIVAERGQAVDVADLYWEYSRQYGAEQPVAEAGINGMIDYLTQYCEVFQETDGRWALNPGVVVHNCQDSDSPQEDYSVYDTPPGQKGSRVFESPKTFANSKAIWCSPPASAVPQPTELLNKDGKRRVRLAAQFDAS